jgi:hypothetical protein
MSSEEHHNSRFLPLWAIFNRFDLGQTSRAAAQIRDSQLLGLPLIIVLAIKAFFFRAGPNGGGGVGVQPGN